MIAFVRSKRCALPKSDTACSSKSAPLPMWVYDQESLRFLAVNQAAIDHYGYTREEFAGMTIAGVRPEEDVLLLEERLAGARQCRRPGGSGRADGRWR
jgi:PAS domain S-box-containing protein